MGTWDSGNFDSDEAGEYLDDIIRQLRATIEACLADGTDMLDRGEAELMPSVDLLVLICSHYNVSPLIEAEIAKQWKEQYLSLFDSYIDGYTPKPHFKSERRKVIEETFSQLETIAREWDDLTQD